MVDIHWTVQARSLLFFTVFLFLMGYLFSSLFSAFTGLAILMLLVYRRITFQYSLGNLKVTRSALETIVYVNHPVHLKTNIYWTGDPSYAKIVERFPDDVHVINGSPFVFSKISHNQPIEFLSQIQFESRGQHEFSKMTIELYDPWKLFYIRHTSPSKTVFHVHSDPQDIYLAKRTKISEDPQLLIPVILGYDIKREYEGIRTYTPGDSSRDIDWKASSRLQTLATRLFQRQRAAEAIIALDVSRTMRRKTGSKAQIEHGIAIVIQLTHILQSLHHSVGFIAFDEHKIVTSVEPSFAYQEIFQNCSDLPTILPTDQYILSLPKLTNRSVSMEPTEDQLFLSTLSPFLTDGAVSLKHGIQVTGVYQTVEKILHHGKKSHIIIISDIGSNHDAFYTAINLASSHQHTIWLLCMDAPQYNLKPDNIDKDYVEKIYEYQLNRRILFKKLRDKHVEVIELSPKLQTPHIIQTIQKRKG